MSTQPSGHEITDTWVYGPVTSRRYGQTWGINLLPQGRKICNFDCVYCQLGENSLSEMTLPPVWPTAVNITQALGAFAKSAAAPATTLVMSGNGEPTLNPHFAKIVTALYQRREEFAPSARWILFSNGTTWHKPEIFSALACFDEVALKWDPNSAIVNRPVGQAKLLCALSTLATLPHLVLQCCLFAGPHGNLGEALRAEWIQELQTISPRRVDLYTASRPPALPNVRAATHHELQNIQTQLQKQLVCPVTLQV